MVVGSGLDAGAGEEHPIQRPNLAVGIAGVDESRFCPRGARGCKWVTEMPEMVIGLDLEMESVATRLDQDLLISEEIERLLKACSRRAPTGIRNRAMLALCWRAGLRISEVLSLA